MKQVLKKRQQQTLHTAQQQATLSVLKMVVSDLGDLELSWSCY